METSEVQSQLAGENLKKPKSKSKVSKVKGSTNRKRFQLFDPAVKSDFLKLCGGGVVQLLLENEEEKDNLVTLDFDGSSEDEVENLPTDDKQPQPDKEGQGQGQRIGLFCGSCNVGFPDLTEQRIHYTLDWHRYNVKRKLHGQDYVAEAKFYEMMDDLSSIDGSDNEEEDVPPVIASGAPIERLLEKLQTDPDDLTPPQVEKVRLSSSQKMEQSPRIFFKTNQGQIISCFKTIVHSIARQGDRKTKDSNDNPVSNFLSFCESSLKITIIMASGGHFAAAVFEGNTCSNHKTFHSYTVRAKQGGGQSSKDSKSGTSHPKSAGASLRRYNEQSFTQHIQELLTSWKSSIADSHLIFYRAAGSNSNIFFGGKNPPLNRDSPKVRKIPVPTKRPTFNEVKRVHSFLTTAHVYESMDAFLEVHTHFVKAVGKDKTVTTSPSKAKKTFNRAKSRSPKRKDDLDIKIESDSDFNDEGPTMLEEVDQVVDFNELKEYDDSLTPEERKGPKKKSKKPKSDKVFKPEGILGDLAAALQKSDLETFQTLLNNLNPSSGDTPNLNELIDSNSSTLLHLAAKNNHVDIVWLLMDLGCDPAVKDKSGKCPYNYADSRECRDIFRKFMGQFPEKYDYKKAQVPPPLSEEMEKERAEKKKLLNKLKREKEKQKKSERMEKEKETEEQKRFLGLSDREKRALAAEQRILAQCKRNAEKAPILVRCFECAADITGKVPFEYNQNVFCTPKCLAVHRKKFPTPLSVL